MTSARLPCYIVQRLPWVFWILTLAKLSLALKRQGEGPEYTRLVSGCFQLKGLCFFARSTPFLLFCLLRIIFGRCCQAACCNVCPGVGLAPDHGLPSILFLCIWFLLVSTYVGIPSRVGWVELSREVTVSFSLIAYRTLSTYGCQGRLPIFLSFCA